jgi:diphosphomevalonate decarboxylase
MITVRTPINIALCKYWGKEDEELIIPCNSSISATLSTEKIYTETKISIQADEVKEDSFFLNGEKCEIGKRLRNCILMLREEAKDHFPQWNAALLIESWNSFPTAAGMASSASGLAAVCLALWKLYKLNGFVSKERLSCIARIASGSSCRSLFGGFVEWKSGIEQKDSLEEELEKHLENDRMQTFEQESKENSFQRSNLHLNDKRMFSSFAIQLAPSFEDLCILVYPFSCKQKKISSTEAMKRTKKTSPLFSYRISHVVPQRLAATREAIDSKDIPTLFREIMQDSNNFHATCLDSWPPISYLNTESWKLIEAVHEFNAEAGIEKVAYSFDAGANAFLFVERPILVEWEEFVKKSFLNFPAPIITRMSTVEEELLLWSE